MKKIIKFYTQNKFLTWLFILSFILRLIVILILKTPIESDFKTMYEASLEIIKGTNHYYNSPYFINWGYQMGHVLYQVILLKIIPSSLFLKIVNGIITSLIVSMIYIITKKISDDKSAKIASIIYAVFPFPLLLNSVLTNQHLPILLVLIALYNLMIIDYTNYKDIIKKSLIIGILISFSNIIRSEGIVFIFSILLYLIVTKLNIKKLLCTFGIILLSYVLISNSASYITKKTQLSQNGLKNMNPYWKFVLGFNYETSGMYSEIDASIYPNDKEKAIAITKERIKDYKKIPLLLLRKHKILNLNSDLYWSLGYMNDTTTYKVINIINQIFIYVLYGGSIFTLIKYKNSSKQLIFQIILIVYMAVYCLIEVMPRYAYSLQVFEAILLGVSINFFQKMLKKSAKI